MLLCVLHTIRELSLDSKVYTAVKNVEQTRPSEIITQPGRTSHHQDNHPVEVKRSNHPTGNGTYCSLDCGLLKTLPEAEWSRASLTSPRNAPHFESSRRRLRAGSHPSRMRSSQPDVSPEIRTTNNTALGLWNDNPR